MDFQNVPKHAWWIITPLIILPIGYLITMAGYLIYTYAHILPNAKSVTVKTPGIEIVTELANKQIEINEQLQNIIESTQTSIQNVISGKSVGAVASTVMPIPQLKRQAIKLQVQQEQLKILKKDLLNFKTSIETYEQKTRNSK